MLRVMEQTTTARESAMRVNGREVSEVAGEGCTIQMDQSTRESGWGTRGVGKDFSDYVSNQLSTVFS